MILTSIMAIALIQSCADVGADVVCDRAHDEEQFYVIEGVNLRYLDPVLKAYDDFKSESPDLSCFSLIVSEATGDNDIWLYVTFYQDRNYYDDGGNLVLNYGSSSECGFGRTYIFNSIGEMLGWHYIR